MFNLVWKWLCLGRDFFGSVAEDAENQEGRTHLAGVGWTGGLAVDRESQLGAGW